MDRCLYCSGCTPRDRGDPCSHIASRRAVAWSVSMQTWNQPLTNLTNQMSMKLLRNKVSSWLEAMHELSALQEAGSQEVVTPPGRTSTALVLIVSSYLEHSTVFINVLDLLQATLVNACGDHVTINQYTDPDHFWALRGGGGSAWGVRSCSIDGLFADADIINITGDHFCYLQNAS